ncbi:MAG: response regulator, partial [Geopsychrobacter sp.]|nr:response regulator [Geopsychrobacter sp.]
MTQHRSPENPLLLIDDEQSWLQSLSFALKSSAGLNHLLTCDDSSQVMNLLHEIEVSVILLDLNMPHLSGKDLLEQIVQDFPQIPVIILSGMNQLETAVSCIKLGAFDYFVKTTEFDRIIHGLEHALSFRTLQQENQALREHIQSDSENKQNSLADLNSL